ncbi:uncharacterized protein METZ01_LOCUS428461, partial [marine metagenome]
VKQIEPGTLADRAGFEPGDQILQVNGATIKDLIGFQVASSEGLLNFEVQRGDEVY